MSSRSPLAARKADPIIARLAESQDGLVTRRQLEAAGVAPVTIARRTRSRRLRPVERGVYQVGWGPISGRIRVRAALLASRPTARIGFVTACSAHGLLADSRLTIDLVVPGRGSCRGPRTATIHRTRVWDDALDATVLDGLPCTSLARTLIDAAGVLPEQRLRRAVREAEVLGLLDVTTMARMLTRFPGRAGTGRLREMLGLTADVDPAGSDDAFADLFLSVCDRFGLERPAVDVRLDTGLPSLGQADLVYRRERLVIELDGAAVHRTRQQFEEDRRRDSYLAARGWVTLRFTWARLTRDAENVASEVRAVLGTRRPDGSGAGTASLQRPDRNGAGTVSGQAQRRR